MEDRAAEKSHDRGAWGKGCFGAVAIDNNPDAYIQELVHSTFAENIALGDGGALWAQGDATASGISAFACIFWGNQTLGGGADRIGEEFPGVFDLVECDLQGVWPAGLKNLDVDPLLRCPSEHRYALRYLCYRPRWVDRLAEPARVLLQEITTGS